MVNLNIGAIEKSRLRKFTKKDLEDEDFEGLDAFGISTGEVYGYRFPVYFIQILKYLKINDREREMANKGLEKIQKDEKGDFTQDLQQFESSLSDYVILDETTSRCLSNVIIEISELSTEEWISVLLKNKYQIKIRNIFELKERDKYVTGVHFDPVKKKIVAGIGPLKDYEYFEKRVAYNVLGTVNIKNCQDYEEFYSQIFVMVGQSKVLTIELFDKKGNMPPKKLHKKIQMEIEADFDLFDPLCKISGFLKKAKEPLIWAIYG